MTETYFGKIREIGDSKWVSIPSEILKIMNLGIGSKIKITIELPEIKEFRCVKCSHRFDIEEGEEIYCPACDNEDIDYVEEVKDYKSTEFDIGDELN